MQQTPTLTFKLPLGYSFTDLKVRLRDDNAIDLDMDVFKLVCDLNGLDFDKVCANPGPVVSALMTIWYRDHLEKGGERDELMESFRLQANQAKSRATH